MRTVSTFLFSFLLLLSCGLAQTRTAYPVILTGNDLPSMNAFLPGNIVGFRYENSKWEQIPIQVDERLTINGNDIYTQTGTCPFAGIPGLPASLCNSININILAYADPNTFTGADPNSLFDGDDELVFMANMAGSQAPAGSYPSAISTNATRCELAIFDPVNSANSYVYLFENTAGLSPGAGASTINYQFNLLNGSYQNYNIALGFNPENSSVTTPYYSQHFSDRWIKDEIRIQAGNSSGVDILDRHKTLFPKSLTEVENKCTHSDTGFSEGEGAFVANIVGPVRAIRDYVGARSGPMVERIHYFYEQHVSVETKLRVHPIPGNMDVLDLSSNALGMTYYNNLNPAGVTIDGTPDNVQLGALTYEMLEGAQGSMYIVHELSTNVGIQTIYSKYADSNTNQGGDICSGDNAAYGFCGPLFFKAGDSDPSTTPSAFFTSTRNTLFDNPGKTPTSQSFYLAYYDHPLQTSVACGSQPPVCQVPGSLNETNITSSSAQLNWAATNAVNYTLRYRAAGTSTWTTVSGITTTSFTASSLNPQVTYEWQVRSNCGSGSSAYSSISSFTTTAQAPQCDPSQVPSGLSATQITTTSAQLNWNATSADTYTLQHKSQSSGSWTTASGLTTVSYLLTGLNASTTYDFRVRTNCNGGSSSAYSNTSSFTTQALQGCTSAITPTGLVATATSSTSASFSWANSGADKYRIQIASLLGSWTVVHNNNNVTSNSYTFSGLTPGANHAFRVRASCNGQWSGWAAWEQFSTPNSRVGTATEAVPVYSLYPNPGTGRFTLKAEITSENNLKLRVINALGQQVLQEAWSGDRLSKRIDLSQLPKGLYFIKVENHSSLSNTTLRYLKL